MHPCRENPAYACAWAHSSASVPQCNILATPLVTTALIQTLTRICIRRRSRRWTVRPVSCCGRTKMRMLVKSTSWTSIRDSSSTTSMATVFPMSWIYTAEIHSLSLVSSHNALTMTTGYLKRNIMFYSYNSVVEFSFTPWRFISSGPKNCTIFKTF